MEREIKFRGIDIDTGQFMYGSLLLKTKKRFIVVYENGIEMYFQVNPKSVGQYTGLKDKNGKELFESDRCKCRMNGIETHVEEVETEVIYNLTVGAFGHKVISKDSDYKFFGLNSKNLLSCEIIGNIHEQLNKG